MSGIGREAIYSRFFGYLKAQLHDPTGSPFKYCNRRYRPAGQQGQEEYPLFYCVGAGEEYDRSTLFAPAKITLFAHITIQTLDGDDPDVVPEIALNNLADAVEDAVTAVASRTGQSILGGLVQEAWVNGRQTHNPATSSGRYSEQIMAVEMILPRIR
jgi:hypothetical protein